MVQIVLFAAAGVAIQLVTTGLAILFLFTEWSPIPAVGLSVLAVVAAGAGKIFGAACFAHGQPLWMRVGGLAVASVCAAVTWLAFSTTLAVPLPNDIVANYLDGYFGLASGTVRSSLGAVLATMFECGGIAFLWLSGPEGQRYMRSKQQLAVA